MTPEAALERVAAHAGREAVERIEALDRARVERHMPARTVRAPDVGTTPDVDVAFAGGGLALLVAAELAAHGVRVLVLDRARAGATHREWNASGPELEPLVHAGVVTRAELAELVVARYDDGFCAFHGGGRHVVRGVLDHAVDAGALLGKVRAVAAARGVRFADGARVVGEAEGPDAVRVRYEGAGGAGELTARLLVDARGAASPHATADLVCPTVGGVMRGLVEGEGPRRWRRTTGEILVTTDDAPDGRQHVWEGFPGRPGDLTTYLFYYGQAARPEPAALARLYARFFDTLADYKEGEPHVARATFGFIPGWSRATPRPRAPGPRTVLVGDAAARHSPLTFCGFGSMLRSFRPVASRVAAMLDDEGATAPAPDDEPIHAWTGALARLMASGALRGQEQNALLDTAFGSLAEMGQEPYAALLQDRMSARAFLDFVTRTARRRPRVFADVLRGLGLWDATRWSLRVAREARA